MALVKCKECGEQISTKAKSCPKCGANQPKKTSAVTWIFLSIFVVIGWSACSEMRTYETKSKSTAKQASSDPAAYNSQPKGYKERKPPPPPSWKTFSSTDEMTGKVQHFASSPTVSPANKMDFPYHNVQSWIGVGCDKGSTWAYFGFSEAPNLTGDDTKDGYNLIKTRIKWDSNVARVALTQDWGSKFLHFQSDAAAIASLAGSNAVMLELNWYGQQKPRFSYSLNGSSKAIAEIKAECRK